MGRIERPWGLRGDVKVLPLTDYPQRFDVGAEVYADGAPHRVLRSRWQKGRVYLALAGVEGADQAEALRGLLVEIPAEASPAFAEGEYYLDEIEGCRVMDVAGGEVGMVREVLQPGANDVYVVARTGRRDLLVPALRGVVVAVDVAASTITVDLPLGLDTEKRDAEDAD